MDSRVEYGYIFERTLQAIDAGAKTIIHKGGTGSGKTYDLMIYVTLQHAANNPGAVCTVVSESRPHLDIGAIRILKSLVDISGLSAFSSFNETKALLTLQNGAIVEFFSADRIDKALGARRDLLYGNEINSLKLGVWQELARRSGIVIADFNPTAQFWLEDWLAYQENFKIITSNYTNNPFLQDTERRKIELQASKDSNFRRIHVDCEYGTYEGRIFEDWTQTDTFPDRGAWYGLDFGYSNDPTAIVRVNVQDGAIYIDEVLYRTGACNADIADYLFSQGYASEVVICDSAEPKSIEELRRLGVNAYGADKGKGSILAGIDYIKQKDVYVTKRSVNVIKENRNYMWQQARDGRLINAPKDFMNHAIDAIRYALSLRHYETVPDENLTLSWNDDL